MKPQHRAPLSVLLVALILLALAAAFVWLHVSSPWDGARLQPGDQLAWKSNGVVVTPLEDNPDGLRGGDIVTAIDGQPLESYAQVLFDLNAPRPLWHIGQTVRYTIIRDGRAIVLPVTLGSYPLGAILAHEWGTVLFALVSQIVATFVFLRRPNDRAAQVLFLWASGILSATTWSLGLQLSDLVNGIGFWLYKATTFGAYMLFWIAALHFALIFPQPRPILTRHPWIIPGIYVVPYVFYTFYLAAMWPGSSSTLAWLGRWIPGESTLAFIYLVLILSVMIWNYIASPDSARQRIRWVAFAGLLSGGGGLILWTLPSAVLGYTLIAPNALGLLVLPFPLALAIAILRHRLFDIDIIINRMLVYGALTGTVVGTYLLVVGALGALLHAGGNLTLSLLGVGLVAVVVQPLREQLQRAVNRLMYGERDDPYAVLSRLGQRLEATIAPEAVLPTIVETVAQALKLPYAAIALQEGNEIKTVAAYGLAIGEPLVLPLVYQSEIIGQLMLSPRARGEDFSPADRHLLDNIAREAGVAAHAVRLTTDLQRSRERLVTAREEERRRLRRDLHDGLGPALASLTLKIDAARNLLSSDPAAADALLADLKMQTQSAIADIRRLVYELRPPALDELGLVSALREQAAQYGGGSNGLQVSVVVSPQDLPPLSAAVEVAAYRIALEALTNVVRHAHARRCEIRVAWNDAGDGKGSSLLQLEIIDDGGGISPTHRAGVGLSSMCERAAELGGICSIELASGGGTRVFARLPLREKAEAPN